MAGDGSTVLVCDHTDLLKDVSVDVNSTVTCVQLLIRLLDGAREDSVLPSFPTGLGSRRCHRVLG